MAYWTILTMWGNKEKQTLENKNLRSKKMKSYHNIIDGALFSTVKIFQYINRIYNRMDSVTKYNKATHVNILDIILLISRVWNRVKLTAIKNCVNSYVISIK